MGEKKKLTVRFGTYGVSEHNVIYLDYNDGATVPMFFVRNGQIDIDCVVRIADMQKLGWEIEFEDE